MDESYSLERSDSLGNTPILDNIARNVTPHISGKTSFSLPRQVLRYQV